MAIDLFITKDFYRGYNKGLSGQPMEWLWEAYMETVGKNDIRWVGGNVEGLILENTTTGERAKYSDEAVKWTLKGRRLAVLRPVHIRIDYEKGSVDIVKYLPGGLYLGIKMRLDAWYRRFEVKIVYWRMYRDFKKISKRGKRRKDL